MRIPSTCKFVALCEQAQVCTCTLVVLDTIQYQAIPSFLYIQELGLLECSHPTGFFQEHAGTNTYTEGIWGGGGSKLGKNVGCWICLDALTQYAVSTISFSVLRLHELMWSGNCPFYDGLSIPFLLAHNSFSALHNFYTLNLHDHQRIYAHSPINLCLFLSRYFV